MGILSSLLGGRLPSEPPTARQLEYAKTLGIQFPDDISKDELGDLISKAKRQQPPYPNQLELCAEVGLHVEPGITRAQIEQRIKEARDNPTFKPRFAAIEQAEAALIDKEDRETYGDKLIDELNSWEALCDVNGHYMIIFGKGKKVVVDVAELEYAEIVDGKRPFIQLGLILPKITKDPTYYDSLDWEKSVSVKAQNVMYFERLSEQIDTHDVARYQQILANAMTIAQQFQSPK